MRTKAKLIVGEDFEALVLTDHQIESVEPNFDRHTFKLAAPDGQPFDYDGWEHTELTFTIYGTGGLYDFFNALERAPPMTDSPRPVQFTRADLHNMARAEADEVSSLTREALALMRAGGSADRVSRIINDADQALDHLEAVNIDIESRLFSAIKRALRKNTGKPVRTRQTKTTTATPAAAGANVIPFARRARKNDPERPL